MNLREVRCDPRDWIALAEDRNQWRAYVRAVMNLRVPALIIVLIHANFKMFHVH